MPDENLKPLYGDNPLAAEIYVRVSPQAMIHH
jgi:hypothetical protein